MSNSCIIAAAAGAFFHNIVRKREFDRHPFSIIFAVIAVYLILSILLQYKSDNENLASRQGQKLAFKLVSMVVVSLWTNILVYRAFFHPLRHFPGPFGARLSKFWSLGKVMQSKFRWYQVLGDLKEEYGDYVRTGPRELMIFDPAAINLILGSSSKLQKGPFYGATTPQSLHTTRDTDFHRKRRKIWDIAFKQSLTDYGPRIEEFTTLFLSRLSKSVATQVVINDLCIYYSYDVISALAFGIFTQFLDGTQTAEVKNILDNIQSGIVAIGLLVHVPWVLTILETLSVLGGPMKEFNDWSACQVEARRHMQNPKPDIMGHLIEHTENTSSGRALLNADSRVIIGAGSDTTASTLSVLFIILANYPHYQAQLHKELTSIFKDEKYSNLRTSPLLDGIIQEALRLYPSVTFTSQRVIPKDGLSIGTVYIPGDTVVSIATWQIQRDHRNFKDPTQFIPERWTTRPELVLNKSAYLPFSMGAYSCIGKGLAMMELRSVIARTILEYEVLFPENTKFDEKAFFNEIKDHFTSGVPKCELVFKRR
ncbi:hypothetical protein sscle_02g020790 [Sclerotinia sclerotiorum 1980 UF-70]|uniref:Cytochrome P450 n=1 Tax=Sclerotinia sclerotiorum (strain ATCC 18683 / 1980 / Ss-1) TaxID=665079 RepID=A0A1D9PXI6_SCLS1|nr:hypothetical protein sscle_02g020790 [Sclerotinia sclerotiorum 1980 UF-70]